MLDKDTNLEFAAVLGPVDAGQRVVHHMVLLHEDEVLAVHNSRRVRVLVLRRLRVDKRVPHPVDLSDEENRIAS